MGRMLPRLVAMLAITAAGSLHADAPGYGFFVIRTTDLQAALPHGEAVNRLDDLALERLAYVHGSFEGKYVHLDLDSPNERFQLNFYSPDATPPPMVPDGFSYDLSIGHAGQGWDVVQLHGAAHQDGQVFVSDHWRDQTYAVVIKAIHYKR